MGLIANLIPKTFDEAYNLASGILPVLDDAKVKESLFNLFENRRPIFEEMPEVLKKLVPTLKPIFEAVANEKEISDEDTLKYKKEIVTHAKPLLKKLADATKEVLPGLEAIAEANVDMKQMSFLDGEIKQLVEDSLRWGNKLLKSFIKIVKTEEQTSDESNPAVNENSNERTNEDSDKPKEDHQEEFPDSPPPTTPPPIDIFDPIDNESSPDENEDGKEPTEKDGEEPKEDNQEETKEEPHADDKAIPLTADPEPPSDENDDDKNQSESDDKILSPAEY